MIDEPGSDTCGCMRISFALTQRPVYARIIRNLAGLPLDPPSEEEKRDAILVLREGSLDEDPSKDILYLEASRILCDAHLRWEGEVAIAGQSQPTHVGHSGGAPRAP